MSVFTGPELNVGLVGRYNITVRSGRYKESESGNAFGDDGGFNRLSAAWKFGAEADYNRYVFGISGSVGMTNILHDSPTRMRSSVVSIYLGYNF